MKEITFVTGNIGKAKEVARYLNMSVKHVSLDLDEIQSLELDEIVKDKAQRAYQELKTPVLVEDVSLVFHALGKLPGPLTKWFLEELGSEGLCELPGDQDRSCTAIVMYGFHDGKEIHLFDGSISGTVAVAPQGDNGFGWGNTFIPQGIDKTYAQLTDEEKEPFAMRKIALDKLHQFLDSQN